MKKIYEKPTFTNVEIKSNNIFTVSATGTNITWGTVENNTWESLFGPKE